MERIFVSITFTAHKHCFPLKGNLEARSTVTISKHPSRMKQDGFANQPTLRQLKQADPSHLGGLYPVLGGEGCQPAHHSPLRRAEAGSESPPCPSKGHGLPRTESPVRPGTGMTVVQLRKGQLPAPGFPHNCTQQQRSRSWMR